MFEVMTFLAGAVIVADLVIPMTVEFVTGFMQLMYTVISRNQCVFCDKAKALLNTNHIGYVEYNIRSPSSKWLLHLFKEANIKTVPQIFDNNGKHIGGYTELKEYLK